MRRTFGRVDGRGLEFDSSIHETCVDSFPGHIEDLRFRRGSQTDSELRYFPISHNDGGILQDSPWFWNNRRIPDRDDLAFVVQDANFRFRAGGLLTNRNTGGNLVPKRECQAPIECRILHFVGSSTRKASCNLKRIATM